MTRLSCATLTLALFAAPAHAGALADALRDGADECVPMAKVHALATHEIAMNEKQFEFLRGFYVAAPPPSTELPIGDRAEIASDGDDFGVLLIDSASDQTCARFHVTDIGGFLAVINAVGAGVTVKAKDRAGKDL